MDYFSWADSQGIKYSPIEHHAITVQDLEAVAVAQGTELRPGDILLVRSGFVKWYNEATEEERKGGTVNGTAWVGVEGNKESVEWFWDHHFAAVAGDANAFELWPAKDERYREMPHFGDKYDLSTDHSTGRSARQSPCPVWHPDWGDV